MKTGLPARRRADRLGNIPGEVRTSIIKRFPKASAHLWATEKKAYELLGGRQVQLSPYLLNSGSDGGSLYLELEHVCGCTLAWSRLTPSGAWPQPLLRRVGQTIRQIHSLPVAADGYHSLTAREECVLEPTAYWLRTFDWVADYLVRSGMPEDDLRRLTDWIASAGPRVARTRPALIHRDLTCQNILITNDGAIKIIDWERSMIGHPDLDLARLLWLEFGDSPQAIRAFFDGYDPALPQRMERSHRNFFKMLFCLEMLQYFSRLNRMLPRQERLNIRLLYTLSALLKERFPSKCGSMRSRLSAFGARHSH
jgi:serine/threonine protein kinase